MESLLKEIVNGQVRSGEHLVTQALARRFGVSHTPVREALVMLAGMGLVDVAPNRGAIVRRMTSREVREICQVRRALECEAIRLACGRIEVPQLEGLRSELRGMISAQPSDSHEIVKEARSIDSRLHDLIAGRSGNAFLVHELGRLKLLFRAFRDASWDHSEARNDYHRLGAEAHEHMAILEALLRVDRQAAVRAMARHIASGMKYWCRAIPDSPPRNGRARVVARDRVEGEHR